MHTFDLDQYGARQLGRKLGVARRSTYCASLQAIVTRPSAPSQISAFSGKSSPRRLDRSAYPGYTALGRCTILSTRTREQRIG